MQEGRIVYQPDQQPMAAGTQLMQPQTATAGTGLAHYTAGEGNNGQQMGATWNQSFYTAPATDISFNNQSYQG